MSDGTFSDREVRRSLADSDGQVRASDVERENALRALAAHFADGRLDRAEFDERADAALAARMQSQLHALFADLPGPAPVPAAPPDVGASPASAALRQVRRGVAVSGFPLLPLVPVLFVLAVAAAVHGLPPFPLIPLLFILSRRHRRWNREARPWM
jgi:hypothetical protein